MRQFSLKVAGGPLQFDTDGSVADSAARVTGHWTVNPKNNRIVYRPNDGDEVEVDVGWVFNADNQLVVTQAGKSVFTLVETTDGLPRYQLRKNQLVVDPDGDGDFEFTLACLFGLDGDGNLVVSINGKESVIDGYIEDSKSRLRFQFKDKSSGAFPNSLVLSGKWERIAAAADAVRLHFVLDDPALEIAAKPLNLPDAVRIDPRRNHLALVYQSKSHGERRLQFLGSLEIKPNFTLVFKIDDVKDGGVRKSTITVESTFEFDHFQGKVAFFVGKTRTPTSQKLEVSGALSMKVRDQFTLDLSFDYVSSTAGGKTTVALATAVRFEAKGTQIVLSYQQQGQRRQLDVTAKLQKTDFDVSGGVTIANDPQGRTLKAFVGVAF